MSMFARRRPFLQRAARKSARRRAFLSAPVPLPIATAEDVEAVRTLPRDSIGRAIWRYHETRLDAARARELAELDGRLSRFAGLESAAAAAAEAHLVRAIRAMMPDPAACNGEAVGLDDGDTLYIATPGVGGVVLVVVERAAIRDVSKAFDVGAVVPGPAPSSALMANPAALPGWLVLLMRAADELGEAEARRRIFGHATRPVDSFPDWRDLVVEAAKEMGQAEASRRMYGPTRGRPG